MEAGVTHDWKGRGKSIESQDTPARTHEQKALAGLELPCYRSLLGEIRGRFLGRVQKCWKPREAKISSLDSRILLWLAATFYTDATASSRHE